MPTQHIGSSKTLGVMDGVLVDISILEFKPVKVSVVSKWNQYGLKPTEEPIDFNL